MNHRRLNERISRKIMNGQEADWSGSIAAAWEVGMVTIKALGGEVTYGPAKTGWQATYSNNRVSETHEAGTLAEALCLAALKVRRKQ